MRFSRFPLLRILRPRGSGVRAKRHDLLYILEGYSALRLRVARRIYANKSAGYRLFNINKVNYRFIKQHKESESNKIEK